MIPARGPQTMFHHYHRMAFLCLQSFGRLRLALLCLCVLGIALPYLASRIQKLCDIQLLLYCLSPADNACHISECVVPTECVVVSHRPNILCTHTPLLADLDASLWAHDNDPRRPLAQATRVCAECAVPLHAK